jgi:hypothetical protein
MAALVSCGWLIGLCVISENFIPSGFEVEVRGSCGEGGISWQDEAED